MASRSRNIDDSVASNISTSNVHSLRRLFETNFKLTNITNIFKTRNRIDRSQDFVKNDSGYEKPNLSKRPSASCKENVSRASFHLPAKLPHKPSNIVAPVSHGNYFNCKKDNCSCRSIYRQYDQTPKFRTCSVPSEVTDERPFASRPGSNRYYRLNYEFYKTKVPDNLPTTPTLSVKSKNMKISKNGREKTFNSDEKRLDVQQSLKQSEGFVNFTADSLSEGGYVKLSLEMFKQTEELEKLDVAKSEEKNTTIDSFANVDSQLKINFDFKQRIPRTKSISVREHSYPYSLNKSRVTVKSVKNRNQAKNARKKEKFESDLSRSHTFAGYDNFAYRPCVTDAKFSNFNANDELKTVSKINNSTDFTFPTSCPITDENLSTEVVVQGREYENSRPEPRNFVNTSFSTTNVSFQSSSAILGERNEKLKSSNSKIASDGVAVQRKCNLKRHFSLGNLERDDYRQNYFKLGHSLDDIKNHLNTNKKSTQAEGLENIFNEIAIMHPYLKSDAELYGQGEDALINLRRKKTTIRQLFTAASKFQKHLKRGVYLSCLLYHEDKILVTNEDYLPVIEVDANFPKNIRNDFQWFFKLSFCWNHLKSLKNEMTSCENSSMDFRIKLLQAASYMQTALSVQHLGKVYHKLLTDSDGTTVICLVNHAPTHKSVSVLNSRWVSLAKFSNRTSTATTHNVDSNVSDILTASITNQIAYHQSSCLQLPRGLYVCYLKVKSSVDSLQLCVPSEVPNILPYYKIRDNPYVTIKEWHWLVKKENLRETTIVARRSRDFVRKFAVATNELLSQVGLSDSEVANLKLYDVGPVAINDDVSLIIVASAVETILSNESSHLPTLFFLPLPVFEVVHFDAYQTNFISVYSKISCVLEVDITVAQHRLREAFDSTEINEAKSKLARLNDIQSRLSAIWKKKRWLLDVVSFARSRCTSSNDEIRFILNTISERSPHSKPPCNSLTPRRDKSKDRDRLTDAAKSSFEVKSGSAETVLIDKLLYPTIPSCDKRYGGKCVRAPVPGSAIMTIYAAYDTGLDSQVHFRFHISPKTTAKEIVELFVKQTNMTTLLRGKRGPIYGDDELENFTLVSTIGTREQRIPDDFRPAWGQNMWKDGRIFSVQRRNKDSSCTPRSYSQQSYAHV